MLRFQTLVTCSLLALTACTDDPTPTATPDDPTPLVEHPSAEVIGAGSTIVAEVVGPGRSVVAFVRDPEGKIGMLEHGLEGSRPVNQVPELADATPLELFEALAPGRAAPAELVDAHARLVAAGHVSTMPAGFALDVSSFHTRAYSSCTNINAWKDADNGDPVGPNCKAGGECLTNRVLNFFGCQPGGGCFPQGWHDRSRWSTCNLGTGEYLALLSSYPGDGTFLDLVNVDTSAAGAYYHFWRTVPGNNDNWSMGKWNHDAGASGHFSIWAD
jgi:hypothetical protein